MILKAVKPSIIASHIRIFSTCTIIKMASRFNINPPEPVKRLPLPPTEGFESDDELEIFAKSLKLEDYKGSFDTSLQRLALRIPASEANTLIRNKDLKDLIFSSPKVTPIHPDPSKDPTKRILQLNLPVPTSSSSTSTSLEIETSSLPPELQSLLSSSTYSLLPHSIPITFSHFTMEQILHSVLPLPLLSSSGGVPTSFTTTGHLAHLNLRTQFLPYKYFIASLILAKNPSITTVVNKLDSIDTVFRFFKMELIGGKAKFQVEVNEGGCKFNFDFREVYWNSRLSTEHGRLVEKILPGEVLVDCMAGVGPFSLPTAKNGGWVFSNDLNPKSFEGLKRGKEGNGGVVRDRIKVVENVGGDDFIKRAPEMVWETKLEGERKGMGKKESWKLDEEEERERKKADKRRRLDRGREKKELNGVENLEEKLEDLSIKDSNCAKLDLLAASTNSSTSTVTSTANEAQRNLSLIPDHYILNLPDSALTFLGNFRGSFVSLREKVGDELEKELKRRRTDYGNEFPVVHVHCFTKETETEEKSWEDVCKRANYYLSIPSDSSQALRPPSDPEPTPELELHLVRAVAPNKDMYCLTFRLTREILFDE